MNSLIISINRCWFWNFIYRSVQNPHYHKNPTTLFNINIFVFFNLTFEDWLFPRSWMNELLHDWLRMLWNLSFWFSELGCRSSYAQTLETEGSILLFLHFLLSSIPSGKQGFWFLRWFVWWGRWCSFSILVLRLKRCFSL